MAKGGRPPAHDRAEVMRELCERISKGALVKSACHALGVTRGQVWQWTQEDDAFRDAYARAREEQAHAIADEAMTIADSKTDDAVAVARNRLRVDTRKWLASKIAPRHYGERQTLEHTGDGGGPVTIRVVRE